MPAVTLPASPSGFPRATTSCPTRSVEASPKGMAGAWCLRRAARRGPTADLGRRCALRGPSRPRRHLDSLSAGDDVGTRQQVPVGRDHRRASRARPRAVWTATAATDGSTASATGSPRRVRVHRLVIHATISAPRRRIMAAFAESARSRGGRGGCRDERDRPASVVDQARNERRRRGGRGIRRTRTQCDHAGQEGGNLDDRHLESPESGAHGQHSASCRTAACPMGTPDMRSRSRSRSTVRRETPSRSARAKAGHGRSAPARISTIRWWRSTRRRVRCESRDIAARVVRFMRAILPFPT